MSKKIKSKPVENPGSKNILIPGILGSLAILLVLISMVLLLKEIYLAFFISIGLSFAAGVYAFIYQATVLRKTGKRIEEMTRERMRQGEFISGFSHRIREPLNNLVIVGELLSDTTLTEKQKDLIETLIASTTNMVSTVNELTMQGAETIAFGKRKAIRFNLLPAIQNTIEIFNLKGIAPVDFSVESAVAPGPELTGDPIIIKQIIIDLLNNLTHTTGQIEPSLKITIDEPEIFEDHLNVTIRFLSASELLNDYPDDYPEPLSLRLIKDNSGRYEYKTITEGHLLTVTLPFSPAGTDETQKTVISPKIAALAREKPRKREIRELNLLLVEDNDINQKITYLTLKPLVKSIDTASNGKEALDMIATADYDIILMDIQMPVMDGLVATEKIRALEKSTGRHVPIIAITANAMLGDKEKCLAAGMDDYISKPFHPAALIGKIKDFFEIFRV
ncbi:MAG: response regulator [Bacteroidales bacterium]